MLVSEIALQQTPVSAASRSPTGPGWPGGRSRPRWPPTLQARQSGSGAAWAIPAAPAAATRPGCARPLREGARGEAEEARRQKVPTRSSPAIAATKSRPPTRALLAPPASAATRQRRWGRLRLRRSPRGPRHERPASPSRGWPPARSSRLQPSTAEYRLAESLLPEASASLRPRWSVAVMELGALTCTAARPQMRHLPGIDPPSQVAGERQPASRDQASRPALRGHRLPPRSSRALAAVLLRDSAQPVPPERFDLVWPDTPQRARALDGLVADGLADPLPNGTFALPALCRPDIEGHFVDTVTTCDRSLDAESGHHVYKANGSD